MSAETWTRFVDDARPVAAGLDRHPSPARGDRAVPDTDLPSLDGYRGDVRLVVTGGAGQLAGPAAWCRRHGVEVSAVDLTVRDLDDPLTATRRLLAALAATIGAGDLLDDTVVHVRVAGATPTPGWLAALDLLAEREAVVALPLDACDPEPWVDAAMDRECQVSLVGGSAEQAVAALRTAARLWGDESDLAAARRWVRSWLTTDPDAALERLAALT